MKWPKIEWDDEIDEALVIWAGMLVYAMITIGVIVAVMGKLG